MQGRREDEFRRYPKWKKYWKSLLKKEENENDDKKLLNQFYRSFVKTLVVNFLDLLDGQDYTQAQLDKDFLLYAERFMELMIDLQALLPTRRYLNGKFIIQTHTKNMNYKYYIYFYSSY